VLFGDVLAKCHGWRSPFSDAKTEKTALCPPPYEAAVSLVRGRQIRIPENPSDAAPRRLGGGKVPDGLPWAGEVTHAPHHLPPMLPARRGSGGARKRRRPAHAGEYRARSERRLGELMAAMPKHEGGRPQQKNRGNNDPVFGGREPGDAPATLSSLGIDKTSPMPCALRGA
jgi:hypothetical protein